MVALLTGNAGQPDVEGIGHGGPIAADAPIDLSAWFLIAILDGAKLALRSLNRRA